MTNILSRLARAYGAQPWLIDEARAAQMVEALVLRAEFGAREARSDRMVVRNRDDADGGPSVAVIRLHGTIAPRLSSVSAESGNFVGLEEFGRMFDAAAARADIRAIVLDIDSPGGQVDLVQETAARIRAARRADRPIIAVANTLAASAAYWIASAADEIVVTPSGQVGSIGVLTVHEDISDRMAKEGVRVTVIRAAPRKAESHPFAPLSDEARGHLQRQVAQTYEAFVADVAANRGVSADMVRADPESAAAHFGGGRTALAGDAVRLGMADRVATLDQVVREVIAGGKAGGRTTRRGRALALI